MCPTQGTIRGGVRPLSPPPGPAGGPLLTSGPALRATGRRRMAAAAVARRALDWTVGLRPGAVQDWAGALEGLARHGWRDGLPGLGKGLEQKFLIPASSCLARLHHSLLINRFLLPSSPTGRPFAPRRGCRTQTLPRAAPRPQGQLPPQPPPARGSLPCPARSLPHPPPRGGGPWTLAAGVAWGLAQSCGSQSYNRRHRLKPGYGWGGGAPCRCEPLSVTWHPRMGRVHRGKDMREGVREGNLPVLPYLLPGSRPRSLTSSKGRVWGCRGLEAFWPLPQGLPTRSKFFSLLSSAPSPTLVPSLLPQPLCLATGPDGAAPGRW